MSRLKEVDRYGIQKLISYIAANPTATQLDIAKYAENLGYDSKYLIPTALGSVLSEKNNVKLDKSLQEILEKTYDLDVTPGKRTIIDPDDIKTLEGREIAKKYKLNPDLLGEAEYGDIIINGKKINVPIRTILRDAKDPIQKLRQIGVQKHEQEHFLDVLTEPEFIAKFEKLIKEKKAPSAGEKGHHFGQPVSIEAKRLQEEVRDLPEDNRINKAEAQRRSLRDKLETIDLEKFDKKDRDYINTLKSGLKINPKFSKLMAVLGPVGALMSAGSEASEGKYGSAALKAASAIDPIGVADAALTIKERLEKSPEERKEQLREDKYTAMPAGLDSPADIILDKLEDEIDVEKEIKKTKQRLYK